MRRLAEELLDTLPRIDVLVNNAGGYWNTRHVTADGIERTFAVNHLAPFLLTALLLAAARGRATTVAWSPCHPTPRPWVGIDFDDLQGERAYSGARAYNQSKLANILFTHELASRLHGTGSPRTPCTPAWCAPPSAPRTPDSPNGFSSPWPAPSCAARSAAQLPRSCSRPAPT